MSNVDTELEHLAEQVLVNAYWRSFSALVNTYLAAAAGLDTDLLEMRLGEASSVFGRDGAIAATGICLDISTQTNTSAPHVSHTTILGALTHASATAVHVQGEKVFERQEGEWHFVGE